MESNMMINEQIGYVYIDAVLALVPNAKFYPSDSGEFADCEWVDDRDRPSNEAVSAKLLELQGQQGLYFLRKERNKLLIESDWTQGDDVPSNIKTPWTTYRQSLRDITNTYTSLEDVVWPTKPE